MNIKAPCLVLFAALSGLSLPFGPAYAEGEDEMAWNTVLKQKFFADRPIAEDTVVEITAPYRAEDPGLVPIQVTSKIPRQQITSSKPSPS